jgi:hypothetical protein
MYLFVVTTQLVGMDTSLMKKATMLSADPTPGYVFNEICSM